MMKNLSTKAAALVLAFVMSLSMISCASGTDTSGTDTSDSLEPVSITVTTTEEVVADDNGVEVVDTCVDTIEVTGGGEGAAEKIAQLFDEQFVRSGEEFIEIQREGTAQVMEEMGLTSHSYYKRMVSVPRSDDGLFVLYVRQSFYSLGAAHGYYAASAINFDPITGEKVALSDIGVNGDDPTEDIARLLTDKFMRMEQSGDYGYSWDTAYADIYRILSDDYDQWYLCDAGFVLISNPYDLASYASGDFEVALLSEELGGIVDDRWFNFGQYDSQQSIEAENPYQPHTCVYSDEAAQGFSELCYMGEFDTEAECNIIWWDTDMEKVGLVPVQETENGGWACTIPEYSVDLLPRGHAVVLTATIPEGIPSHAIMAVGKYSTYYYWLLTYDGLNGGIHFVEIEPESVG